MSPSASPPNKGVFPSPLLKARPATAARRLATASPSPRSRKRKLDTPTSPATEERVIMLADKPKTLRTVERLEGAAAAEGGDEGALLKLPLAWQPLTVTPPENDRVDACITPGALSAEMH